METDPVELTPEYRAIEQELEALLEEEFKNFPQGLGFCHIYWYRKKEVLKEKYGIDWRSPAEMNPLDKFD